MAFTLQNNITKLYASNFLTGLVFWYATEKLFMQSIGLSSFDIALNAVVFLAITVLFDVPSGVLADKWKRKYTLLLAIVCLALCHSILGTSSTLPIYLVGTALYGAYVTLTYGTFQAMMYDSLAELGQEKEYDKHQGRAFALFFTGIGVSSLAGGYIGEFIGLRETYLYSLLPALLAAIVILSTREPKFHKENFDANMWKHIKTSLAIIAAQPLVFHLAMFMIVSGLLRSTQNEFGGLYYLGLGLSAVAMGYANAGKWIASALGQFAAHYVGRDRAFTLLPWFFIAYLAFSLITNASGIVFFMVAACLYSLVTNQAEATIQGATPSHVRATTISIISFLTNVVMIPLSLAFGWVAQNNTPFQAFQVFGVIGIGYAAIWLLLGRRHVRAAHAAATGPAADIELIK
ncbi:MAG TPA: MFS transporter [Candidatus Saccharimonadales bacterium]|nr:MFS transporter [Candidatus Saccharimonadales bacterium]